MPNSATRYRLVLVQVMDWAKKCLELIKLREALQKGRVPEAELAERIPQPSELVADEPTADSADLKSNDTPQIETKPITIKVYKSQPEAKTKKNREQNSPKTKQKQLATSRKANQSPQTSPVEVVSSEASPAIQSENDDSPTLTTASSSGLETVSAGEVTELTKTVESRSFEKIEAPQVDSADKSQALQPSSKSGVTILIIDDYAPLREMLSDAFQAEGYAVCVARDGLEGLVRLHENEVDLIVSDVQMPRVDGFDMSRMLNVRESTREIPVVFLTEVLDEKTKAIAKRLGAADTLIKPFSMDDLLESVQRILKLHCLAPPVSSTSFQRSTEVVGSI